HSYGVDDIPVVIADKSFDEAGELVIDDGGNEVGFLGDVVTVNGVAGARLEVTTQLVRLRILNASTARTYSLGLPEQEMLLIASGGGLLRAPLEVTQVRLSRVSGPRCWWLSSRARRCGCTPTTRTWVRWRHRSRSVPMMRSTCSPWSLPRSSPPRPRSPSSWPRSAWTPAR